MFPIFFAYLKVNYQSSHNPLQFLTSLHLSYLAVLCLSLFFLFFRSLLTSLIHRIHLTDISLSHSPNLSISHTTHLQPSSLERRMRHQSNGGGAADSSLVKALRWLHLLSTTTDLLRSREREALV